MPTRIRDDGTPIVTFDPILEVSPFTLFKRLQRAQPTLLVDIRREPGTRSLQDAVIAGDPEWEPTGTDMDVVLFDDDGSLAVAAASQLQESGYNRVKALFGGLDLYEFSLDPEILETDTFLRIEN